MSPIILLKSFSIATIVVFLWRGLCAYHNRNIKSGEGIVSYVEPILVPFPVTSIDGKILISSQGEMETLLTNYYVRFAMEGQIHSTCSKMRFKKGEKIAVVYEEKENTCGCVMRTILSISKIEKNDE